MKMKNKCKKEERVKWGPERGGMKKETRKEKRQIYIDIW